MKLIRFLSRCVRALAFVGAAGVLVALHGAACGRRLLENPDDYTVKGPEDPTVGRGLRGQVVRVGEGGEIEAYDLDTLKRRVVRRADAAPWPKTGHVHALSGPDAEGRVAVVDNYMGEKRHELTVVDRAGRQTTLFTRPGDALWGDEIGDELAMAPVGGKIAFVSGLKDAQMRNPSALLKEGMLELWDAATGKGGPTKLTALDSGMSWFPDGRRLAFTVLEKKASVQGLPLKPDGFGGEFAGWDRVPVVHVLDTKTGRAEPLHVGWDPVVSRDGRSVVVSDLEYRWRSVDAATGRSVPASAPGSFAAPLALFGDGVVVYIGLPTRGAELSYTKSNSPLVGPKLMLTIKAAKLSTGRFRTLITGHDTRHAISVGGSLGR